MTSKLRHCPLRDSVCVAVRGADAFEFLRGQLTNDLPAEPGQWTLAAWNDARGRVRALFRVLRTRGGCVLITERETVDTVLAALRMFVLRAKVELRVEDGWRVAAVLGPADEATKIIGPERHGEQTAAWLRIGPELAYVAGPGDAVRRALRDVEEVAERHAELAEIRLGLPRIRTATMQQYVPQMLNLDALGAVSFTKGCYPGQEVVARLHHRGAVKRRMQRFRFDTDERRRLPEAGEPIMRLGGDSEHAAEAVGETIRAASTDSHGELLAVVRLDALDSRLTLSVDPPIPLHHEQLYYDAAR